MENTYDGTTVQYYYNGVPDGSTTETIGSTGGDSANLAIGSRTAGAGFPYTGTLDDVRIYNRALSAQEVKRLYNMGGTKLAASQNQKITNGLVGLWSFDGNDMAGTVAYDRSGQGNNGTLTNGPTRVGGKLGQALSFDGSDDAVDMGDPASGVLDFGANEEFSVSFWMRVTIDETVAVAVSKRVAGDGYEFRRSIASGWFMRINESTGGNTDTLVVTSKANLGDGAWHHIIFGRDTTRQFIYVDGIFNTSSADASVDAVSNSDSFIIGDSANAVNGTIDDVRVYNRALSAQEIKRLYNMGGTKLAASQNQKITNGLVGLWSFDGADMAGTVAYDRSGQGNNGTLTNGPRRVGGKLGQALQFDGVDDYVDVGNGSTLNPTGAITLSAWVQSKDTKTLLQQVIVKNISDGAIQYNLSIRDLTGKVRFTTNTSAETDLNFNTALANNTWYHIVGVWNGTTMTGYLNGVSDATPVSQSGTMSDNGQTVRIGSNRGTTPSLTNGVIDDVRIYNRALSAQEVKRLYNIGHSN